MNFNLIGHESWPRSMLVVTLIDMSLVPLQITITSGRISRFQCGLSVWGQQRQVNSIIPVSVRSFFAAETVGNFCSLRVGTDSLKLFCPPRNQTLPVWVQYLITVSLVFRIRRWRLHLPLRIPGSISCTLCFEKRTILSLGERKGTHFNLLFSNAKTAESSFSLLPPLIWLQQMVQVHIDILFPIPKQKESSIILT